MTALVLSIVLGAEVLSPTIVMPAVSGAPVQVAAAPGTIDVVLANRDTYVVWADERRVQGLLTATAVVNPVADLWVRALDGGLPPSLVCPERSPALSTRLAATATGRVGIAWRRGTAGELALSVLNPGFELSASCGRQLAPATRGRPAITALDESFRVAFETGSGVFGGVHDGGSSGLVAPLFPGCAQPSLAETPDGSWAGALCDGGLALRKGTVIEPVTPEPATAFTLVPELDGPGLLRVDGSGAVWFHAVASLPSTRSFQSVAGQQPFAAVANESALLALWGTGTTTIVSDMGSLTISGVPAGLAANGQVGQVATQLSSGVVLATELKVAPGVLQQFSSKAVSTARVLQRRPSVAWWDEAQRWLLTWEEVTTPNTWTARAALVNANGAVRLFPLPSTLGWPRVLRRPDGAVRLYSHEGLRTFIYAPSLDGGLTQTGTLDFVARGGVAGPASTFFWSDPAFMQHLEFVDTALGPGTIQTGTVISCATWVGGASGGDFVVTREATSTGGYDSFPDTQHPSGGFTTLSGPTGCVSARMGTSQLALAVVQRNPSHILLSRDAGTMSSIITADAGLWGLQLAPTATGWLVAYNSDAGVFAASVDDAASSAPRYYRLDTAGIAHGDPSIAPAPNGAVAVAWASLIGDSVEVQMRVFDPADAGVVVDAGVVDAGVVDAGVVDAGVVDAGVVDAGVVDAGVADAGVADGGVADAGVVDAGVVDAGVIDAGVIDAGVIDAGVADAGVIDAGVADAGVIDGVDAGQPESPIFVSVCGCGVPGASSAMGLLLLALLSLTRRRHTLEDRR